MKTVFSRYFLDIVRLSLLFALIICPAPHSLSLSLTVPRNDDSFIRQTRNSMPFPSYAWLVLPWDLPAQLEIVYLKKKKTGKKTCAILIRDNCTSPAFSALLRFKFIYALPSSPYVFNRRLRFFLTTMTSLQFESLYAWLAGVSRSAMTTFFPVIALPIPLVASFQLPASQVFFTLF